jgi:hypothetical protein
MFDSILLLIKFINHQDGSEIFVRKSNFEETIEINDFREEVGQILLNENPSFKIKRICYIDTDFGEQIDLPKVNFIFENKQKFIVICETEIINLRELEKDSNNKKDNAAMMSCTFSMDSINLEESDKSTEDSIIRLITKNLGESVPRFLTPWRKKVVRVIGAYLMLN